MYLKCHVGTFWPKIILLDSYLAPVWNLPMLSRVFSNFRETNFEFSWHESSAGDSRKCIMYIQHIVQQISATFCCNWVKNGKDAKFPTNKADTIQIRNLSKFHLIWDTSKI